MSSSVLKKEEQFELVLSKRISRCLQFFRISFAFSCEPELNVSITLKNGSGTVNVPDLILNGTLRSLHVHGQAAALGCVLCPALDVQTQLGSPVWAGFNRAARAHLDPSSASSKRPRGESWRAHWLGLPKNAMMDFKLKYPMPEIVLRRVEWRLGWSQAVVCPHGRSSWKKSGIWVNTSSS